MKIINIDCISTICWPITEKSYLILTIIFFWQVRKLRIREVSWLVQGNIVRGNLSLEPRSICHHRPCPCPHPSEWLESLVLYHQKQWRLTWEGERRYYSKVNGNIHTCNYALADKKAWVLLWWFGSGWRKWKWIGPLGWELLGELLQEFDSCDPKEKLGD